MVSVANMDGFGVAVDPGWDELQGIKRMCSAVCVLQPQAFQPRNF